MKKFLVLLLIPLVMGCTGFQLFPEAEPLCTPEEQVDSLIYRYFDPATADFTLMVGVAAFLDKYPEKADELDLAYDVIGKAVEKGISYDALFDLAGDELGELTYFVVSKYLVRFKGIKLPLSTCDRILILGHVASQKELIGIIK